MLSIDHYSRYELKIYIITHIKGKHLRHIAIFSKICKGRVTSKPNPQLTGGSDRFLLFYNRSEPGGTADQLAVWF